VQESGPQRADLRKVIVGGNGLDNGRRRIDISIFFSIRDYPYY
jgi:hypothetical protein